MLSQMLDVTSMQVAEGLIFPKSLSIAAVDTPELAQLQRVDNLSLMFSTFLADFSLIQALQHGCGVSNCFHLIEFICVLAAYAQNYMFSNSKGRKKRVYQINSIVPNTQQIL